MEFIWNNFLSLLSIIGLITVIIFYIGDRLIFYANQLAVVTNISGAFIGFVLIAMITSIPEMVSTFISVKKGLINLAVGGVLGSNMLNIEVGGQAVLGSQLELPTPWLTVRNGHG